MAGSWAWAKRFSGQGANQTNDVQLPVMIPKVSEGVYVLNGFKWPNTTKNQSRVEEHGDGHGWQWWPYLQRFQLASLRRFQTQGSTESKFVCIHRFVKPWNPEIERILENVLRDGVGVSICGLMWALFLSFSPDLLYQRIHKAIHRDRKVIPRPLLLSGCSQLSPDRLAMPHKGTVLMPPFKKGVWLANHGKSGSGSILCSIAWIHYKSL